MDIDAIKARLSAASEGPWERDMEQTSRRSQPILMLWSKRGVVCRIGPAELPDVQADADFIQNAPDDIASLLSALAAERERAEEAEEAGQALSEGVRIGVEHELPEYRLPLIEAALSTYAAKMAGIISIENAFAQIRTARRELSIVHTDHQCVLAQLTKTEQENAALLATVDTVSSEAADLARRVQEEQERTGRMQKILSVFIDGDDAGAYLCEDDWCCLYCDAPPVYSAALLEHTPDCPILAARTALAGEVES